MFKKVQSYLTRKNNNMKILISSKHLASQLNKIDFDLDCVVQVGGIKNFEINTNKQTIKIPCEILIPSIYIKQDNRRWDWVKSLLNKVDEQPIVLQITENIVNVIFQY